MAAQIFDCEIQDITIVEFAKEWERMCETYDKCTDCPVSEETGCVDASFCNNYTMEEIEYALAILQKWSRANPRKTIIADFFEKFPKAMLNKDDLPTICAKELGYVTHCVLNEYGDSSCKDCWNQFLDEVEGDK